MAQYVYTMSQVGKVVPPKREILRDISLSFFPGAKIGVLGLNGSGKSTLLRIMAGIDTEIHGEARPQKGIKVGYLPQEPQLDDSKDVRGNVEEALSEITDAQNRLDEVYAAYAEADADFDALAAEPVAHLKLRVLAPAAWGAHLVRRDEAQLERDLLQASHHLALPLLDGLDEVRGVHQAAMGPGIKPGETAAKNLDLEPVPREVEPVQICNLELASIARSEAGREIDHVRAIEVQPGHGEVALRPARLFLDAEHLAFIVEFGDAVAFRVVHVVGKDCRPRCSRRGRPQFFR